ncbi:MAG: GTP-binding protein [Candidatus Heimdallarchaeota archaeon]
MALVCKITLLGDGAVGKTALRNRFLGKEFTGTYTMTIGADFASKKLALEEQELKFQIWDLAGQPRFKAVREAYYRGAVGALLIYDVVRPSSFENTPTWIMEAWKHNGKGRIPIVVLGNKIDLRPTQPEALQIKTEQGQALAEELSTMTSSFGFNVHFLETSAATGENVEEAFNLLGENILSYIRAKKRQI